MVYQDGFFDELPEDLHEAINIICDEFFKINSDVQIFTPLSDYYDDFLDAFAGLEIFIEANNLDDVFVVPSLGSDLFENSTNIRQCFESVKVKNSKIISQNKYQAARYKYKTQLGSIFSYTFSEGDIKRIQTLINELRDLITESSDFDDKHKARLLTRLEALQKDLHKKMSNLDKLWGLVGDAGVAIGKLGNDAKPFVDRIKEITEIVWRAQSIAEGLPSGTTLPIINERN